MALLKIWGVSRAMMRLLVIQFVWWLGWFSTFALAQFEISEGVTGSVTFPALGVTCVGNLAVLVTSLIRGRLHLEMGARDVLDILSTPELQNIKRIKDGYGLTTCMQEDAAIPGGGDPQTASTTGPETDSTEGNVIRTASTERGGLHTAEIVLPIGSPEGQVEEEEEEKAEKEEKAEIEKEKRAEIAGAFTRERVLKTADVVMLSNGTANWSMRQFIKSNASVVQSIVLQFMPLKRARNDEKVSEELTSGDTVLKCKCRRPMCHCIVFWTMEETTDMLARRMPGTLKRLSNSLCLLPCSTCLTKGCHDCKPENLLRAEGEASQPLRETVVSGILHDIHARYIAGESVCICIPMNDARSDNWTKLLVRSLRSKEAEGRGVRNMATEALEGYLGGGRGSEEGTVEYDIFSFAVPRLTEVLINLVLTFWFKVDGFSSALVARRTVRDYLVDSKSSGFAANAFLTKAVVKSNGDNSQVCQVLTFRGRDPLCMITFISVGCVNLICSVGWALLISFEGGPDNSQPPSLPIVALIIAAIGTQWVLTPLMICQRVLTALKAYPFPFPFLSYVGRNTFTWFVALPVFVLVILLYVISKVFFPVAVLVTLLHVISKVFCTGFHGIHFARSPLKAIISPLKANSKRLYTFVLFGIAEILESVCFVSWSALAGTVGIQSFGRWIYGVLQILIWLKWATGSLLPENSEEFFGKIPNKLILFYYSSPFWLNAVLAGVRSKWEAWPWSDNHLFSFIRG